MKGYTGFFNLTLSSEFNQLESRNCLVFFILVTSINLSHTSFRPRSHGNAIVPFHLRSSFWNAKRNCSHGNAIVPFHSFFFSPCHFFQQKLHSCMRLRQKSYFSIFGTSLAPHCLFTREWNGTIAYCSTFRITYFIVPLFGTERFYFKRSRVNATPERSTFRNETIWNGTIVFPCERGLILLASLL